MTFTIPADVLAQFNSYVEEAYLTSFRAQAERTNEALTAWNAKNPNPNAWSHCPVVVVAGLSVIETIKIGYRSIAATVAVNVPKVRQMAKDSVDHAVILINNRVAKNLAPGETAEGAFWINKSEALIEAGLTVLNAQGEKVATLNIRAIWNYRYGSNSANGVITQYLQFRANRTGERLVGLSAACVADDAAKAEKAAVKAFVAAEKRAAAAVRFVKALKREAKAARTWAKDLRTDSGRPATTAEQRTHWLNLANDYEAKAEKLEAATPEDLIEFRGQQVALLDRFGTASDYACSLR